jgi:diguanylate cyclase (GGDEF)-like protein
MDTYLKDTLTGTGRQRRRATYVLLGSLASILLIALFDQLTGTRVSFVALYVIPVGLLSWNFGRPGGHGSALVAAAAELAADTWTPMGDPAALIAWNAGSVLVLSWIVAEVLTRLHRALDEQRELARTDSLTGVANGRQFREAAEVEIERVTRYGGTFTVAFLDVDHFKEVNDMLGHGTGDQLLREIAQELTSRLRRVDLVARFGGDEFIMLLPETDREAARVALEKVRESIGELARGYGIRARASIGSVTFLKPPASVDEMLRRADAAMYSAKHRATAEPTGPRPRSPSGAWSRPSAWPSASWAPPVSRCPR